VRVFKNYMNIYPETVEELVERLGPRLLKDEFMIKALILGIILH